MSFVGHNVMRWLRGAGEAQAARSLPASQLQPKIERHSSGFAEFMRRISGEERRIAEARHRAVSEEKLCILDLGQTSPINIPFFAQRGIRLYNEDILRAFREKTYVVKEEGGVEQLDVAKFFLENFNYSQGQFDAIICWDIADYLPEPVVKPLVERVHQMLKPGGTMLAFFHTKDAGPDAPYFRYNIAQHDTVELVQGPAFRLQRVFNNRHVENLFKSFASLKFFLGRDHVREVLVVR
jgi:2-polyprenyl-3-methyl-5-hydroxy-6-metoxy-1,4-benzoquinol methylase